LGGGILTLCASRKACTSRWPTRQTPVNRPAVSSITTNPHETGRERERKRARARKREKGQEATRTIARTHVCRSGATGGGRQGRGAIAETVVEFTSRVRRNSFTAAMPNAPPSCILPSELHDPSPCMALGPC